MVRVFKNLMILPLLMGLCITTVAAAEIEKLAETPRKGQFCNQQEDWCVEIDKSGPQASSRTLRASYGIWDLPYIPSSTSLSIWPSLIRLTEDRALVGILETRAQPFSGGGFEAKDLILFDVTLGDFNKSNSVLRIPFKAEISIRACFGEDDFAKRQGACLDEYTFNSVLAPVDGKEDLPDLVLKTQAWRNPAGASRFADSSEAPPLTQDQLGPKQDSSCSYERVFLWSSETSLYNPTSPLPDCREFTEANPSFTRTASACPDETFEKFVTRFSHDIAVQEKSTAQKVIFEGVDMDAQPEPKKTSEEVPLSMVEWPVMPDMATLKRQNLVSEFEVLANGNKQVVLRGTDGGAYMEFEFSQQPCWTLIRVSDQSM
ncbi:hypothetical protein [Pararhizobium polonicum]|uniref:hypothetical protein n=1 Tax=Pararhizobium polonicum TaxID=1612624 RepID=UPI001875D547|nr:hypothetical protein [Pararhizobium polonicum]